MASHVGERADTTAGIQVERQSMSRSHSPGSATQHDPDSVEGKVGEKWDSNAAHNDDSTPGYDGGSEVGPAMTTETKEASTLSFPDGGLRAWLVISGSWCCMFWSFGYVNAFGVLETYYLQTTLSKYSSSDVAWISSLQYFFIFFVGMFTGRLFDAGLFRPTLGVGMFLFVFCQMMVSLSTTYWQLILSQGVGLGLGFGIMFSLAVAVPAHWFNKKRGMAFGIVASGSSIGGVVCPIWIQKLIPLIGFPWTMRVMGFSALAMLSYAWLVMDSRQPPSINLSNGGWKHVKLVEPSAFKVPAYTLFVAGSTFVLFGLYTPFTFIDLFTDQYHIPATGYYLSILNGASIFGRVFPGILADRFGKMNMLVPHLAMCVILIFIFPLCTNLGGMVAFTVLFGYGSGCYVSIIPAAIAQLGTTSSVGTRLGMMFSIMAIGGLLGTPISGAILGDGQHLRWWPTLAYSGACVAAGWLCILASRQVALKSWGFWGKI